MPEFYTWTILLINQLGEIAEKQLSVFGSRGGQICPLMHVPLCIFYAYMKTSFDSLAQIPAFYWDLSCSVLLDFSLTVKAAPHECVIRTGQP